MNKPQRIRLINGDEETLYTDTAEAAEVIFDLVISNAVTVLHASDVIDGTLTLRVM